MSRQRWSFLWGGEPENEAAKAAGWRIIVACVSPAAAGNQQRAAMHAVKKQQSAKEREANKRWWRLANNALASVASFFYHC